MARQRLRRSPPPADSLGSLPGAWSWYGNGPLKGCGLLRERQWIYAWDDANTIYLLDLEGKLIAQRQAPKELVALAADDVGESLLAASRMGQIWWLDANLRPRWELEIPFTPLGVAVEAHGNYAVISSQQGENVIVALGGAKVAQYQTTRPLKFLAFVPTDGTIVGSADQGLIACHDLSGKVLWSTTDWSAVGGMAVDGAGANVLLACFGHGIVRIDAGGKKEGTYRLEHSPALVAVDFDGSELLVASLERTIAHMTFEGTVKASRFLEEKPVGLAFDPLGRYGVLAFGDGELRFFRVAEFFQGPVSANSLDSGAALPSTRGLGAQTPAWTLRLAQNTEEVDSATLEWIPGTPRVAVYTNRRVVRVVDDRGEVCHETADLPGLGRVLTRGPGWLAAYNDRRLVAYDPAANSSVVCSLPTSEISHVELFRAPGDALLIEACEYVARVRLPEELVWKKRFDYKVVAAAALVTDRPGRAVGDGWAALVLDDHNLIVLDQAGEQVGKYRARPAESLNVVALDDGWATAARDSSVVRGHLPDGVLAWTTPLPWPPWSLRRVGGFILVTSAEGYSILLTAQGELAKENREPREGAIYFERANGKIARVFRTGQTVLATTFGGKLLWRHTDEHRLGPYLAGPAGLWLFVGKELVFFPFD